MSKNWSCKRNERTGFDANAAAAVALDITEDVCEVGGEPTDWGFLGRAKGRQHTTMDLSSTCTSRMSGVAMRMRQRSAAGRGARHQPSHLFRWSHLLTDPAGAGTRARAERHVVSPRAGMGGLLDPVGPQSGIGMAPICRWVPSDPGKSVQKSLAHYSSSDGVSFSEVAQNIVIANGQPWDLVEVRAPTVIDDDGVFRMWFAGGTPGFGSASCRPPAGTS